MATICFLQLANLFLRPKWSRDLSTGANAVANIFSFSVTCWGLANQFWLEIDKCRLENFLPFRIHLLLLTFALAQIFARIRFDGQTEVNATVNTCTHTHAGGTWTKYDRANGMCRTTNAACSKKHQARRQLEYRKEANGNADGWTCFVVALIGGRGSEPCTPCGYVRGTLWKMTNVHMQWRGGGGKGAQQRSENILTMSNEYKFWSITAVSMIEAVKQKKNSKNSRRETKWTNKNQIKH